MAHENILSPRGQLSAGIGDRVRTRRLDQNLSQAELAQRAKIGRRTLQRIEGGARPSADTIWRLENALGLTPGDLAPEWDVAGSLYCGSLGARLRQRRQERGQSLKEVADYIKISVASLSRFERGVPHVADDHDEIVSFYLASILGFNGVQRLYEWLASEPVQGRTRKPLDFD